MTTSLLLLIAILVVESRSNARSSWPFTPGVAFCASVILVYVLPIAISESSTRSWAGRLSSDDIDLLDASLSQCIAAFSTTYLMALWRLQRRRGRQGLRLGNLAIHRFAAGLCLLAIIGFGVYIVASVGLAIDSIWQRVTDPRSYTYIKSGYGPLVYINSGLQAIVMFIVGVAYARRQLRFLTALCGLAAVGMLLATGTKFQIVSGFLLLFAGTVTHQADLVGERRGGHTFAITGSIACILVLVLSFMFYSGSDRLAWDNYSGRLGDYQREPFNSVLVMKTYRWQDEYLINGLVDTIAAPVPRAIWRNKPQGGFFDRYWRPDFEPFTVDYHTSTYGFLAEAHMIAGILGPFVYGVLFGLISCAALFGAIRHDRPTARFVAVFGLCMYYFFVRAGFLFATPWLFATVAGMAMLLMRGLRGRPAVCGGVA